MISDTISDKCGIVRQPYSTNCPSKCLNLGWDGSVPDFPPGKLLLWRVFAQRGIKEAHKGRDVVQQGAGAVPQRAVAPVGCSHASQACVVDGRLPNVAHPPGFNVAAIHNQR